MCVNVRIILLLVICLLAACDNDNTATGQNAQKTETALEHAVKHLDKKYHCPMHPQIIRDKPGLCPICSMDLVPIETQKSTTRDDVLQISPAVTQSMGVRTAFARKQGLPRLVNSVGIIEVNEDRIYQIYVRANAWVQNVQHKAVGAGVKKGQLLFEVYSPDLINAQQEFLQALRASNSAMISASRYKLKALAISDVQIAMLERSRTVNPLVQVYAQDDGVITQLEVHEGMYLMPSTRAMTLANLSSVWVNAEVFESHAALVKAGQKATVSFSHYPETKSVEGSVDYIFPTLTAATRTLRVRLRLDNKEGKLRPNMYANVTIQGGDLEPVVVIPREAVIDTGSAQHVILALGSGRFKVRPVTAGFVSGELVQILSGLQDGEQVVTSGQFLLDSEASFKASVARMEDTAADGKSPKPSPFKGKGREGVRSLEPKE